MTAMRDVARTQHESVDVTRPGRRPHVLMVVANPTTSSTTAWRRGGCLGRQSLQPRAHERRLDNSPAARIGQAEAVRHCTRKAHPWVIPPPR
jgi:hypothetical protein